MSREKPLRSDEIQQVIDFVEPLRETPPPMINEERRERMLAYARSLGAPVVAGGILGIILSQLGITRSLLTRLILIFTLGGAATTATVLAIRSTERSELPPRETAVFKPEEALVEEAATLTASSVSTIVPSVTTTATATPRGTATSTSTPRAFFTPSPTHTPQPPEPTATPLPVPTNPPDPTGITVAFVVPQQGANVNGVGNTRFEVTAYDSLYGSSNGNGISQVQFSLQQLDDTFLMSATETDARFCMFGGNSECGTMGQPAWSGLVNGEYRLVVVVTSQAGASRTQSITFTIQVN